MPKISTYGPRVQPLDGVSAIIAQEGVRNWEVLTDLVSGWVGVDETWTYASATTITIPAGGASRYQKGDKVRYKQGGSYKYYYIVTVADTLLTVTGGSDYTVANAAITDIYISREIRPFGFPTYFNFAPNMQGYSAVPTSAIYLFNIVNGWCNIYISESGDGTSNATTLSFTAPVTAAAITNGIWTALCTVRDNGTTKTTAGNMRINTASATVNVFTDTTGTGAWTNSGAKRIPVSMPLSYPI